MKNDTDVALVLCNPDVIDMVSFVLSRARISSSGVEPYEGEERVKEFIASCAPSVVVYDLEPPYRASTAVLNRLLNRFHDLAFVITCADKKLATDAAPWLVCHPILQKPYEPEEIRDIIDSVASRPVNHLIEKAVAVGDFFRAKW